MLKKPFFLFSFILLTIPTLLISQDVQALGGRISQFRSTTSRIGNTNIKIEYHSPLVNGRKIFGGIVPYDFIVDGKEYAWRAGSNNRTTIEFDNDIAIKGKSLPAGKYGFVVLVSEEEWTLVFSKNTSWGAFQYDPSNDALRVKVEPMAAPHQEWLSYDFNNPQPQSVEVQLRWEKTKVSFKVEIDFVSNLLINVDNNDAKTSNDYRTLALIKTIREPEKIDEALLLVEKSIAKLEDVEEPYKAEEEFKSFILKADLLLESGKVEEGSTMRTRMLESAKGFDMYYYGLSKYMVDGKKKEAFDLLDNNIKLNPNQWTGHLALGEYYIKEKNEEQAVHHFKIAYEHAPENWKNYARYLYLQNKMINERK